MRRTALKVVTSTRSQTLHAMRRQSDDAGDKKQCALAGAGIREFEMTAVGSARTTAWYRRSRHGPILCGLKSSMTSVGMDPSTSRSGSSHTQVLATGIMRSSGILEIDA